MGKTEIKVIRQADTIGSAGVGAIVDIASESLIAMDTTYWPENSPILRSARLEEALHVPILKSAPDAGYWPSEKSPGIRFQRFPAWLFCQNCRRMRRLTPKNETGAQPECLSCHGLLVPMRFVAVCESGSHIQDVPWARWLHRAATGEGAICKDETSMRFLSASGGNESLSGLSLKCDACETLRSLGGITSLNAMKSDGFKCWGKQPWELSTDGNPCDAPLRVIQRGATNAYYAETYSALDIPEGKTELEIAHSKARSHPGFGYLLASPTGVAALAVAGEIADEVGFNANEVLALAESDRGEIAPLATKRSLLSGEWAAFIEVVRGDGPSLPNFSARPIQFNPVSEPGALTYVAQLVSSVVLVDRLREVRAMRSFRRYDLGAKSVLADLGTNGKQKWFPAVESFGEGIFVSFDEPSIRQWEDNPEVRSRYDVLARRRDSSKIAERLVVPTPRFILLHTLAHLLIRRLSFDSGYAAASLRERIYAYRGDHYSEAGFLIYTAAGDIEGTLGGLVRQGEQLSLSRTLLASLEDADWCSNDPLCRESPGQGMDALNLAACHGCALCAETSCEYSNLLLDRSALVGGDSVPGFFDQILASARAQVAAASR
jgi:hypothetical protein